MTNHSPGTKLNRKIMWHEMDEKGGRCHSRATYLRLAAEFRQPSRVLHYRRSNHFLGRASYIHIRITQY